MPRFFYDIHVDHCEPMASRVFSKTKHTYSIPLSHELEALPWRPHNHLHTPKIPSPRSALIFMCRSRDIRSIPLRLRKLFSSSEFVVEEGEEGEGGFLGVRRGLIDEKAGRGGLRISPSKGIMETLYYCM